MGPDREPPDGGREPATTPRLGAGRDAAWLALASLLSGGAAYVFVVTGTRSVGAEAFAPVSILWTVWAAAAAVLTFPVQHWVIRSITAEGSESGARGALRQIGLLTVALSAVTGLLAWLLGEPLFGSRQVIYPLLASAIPLGSVLMGLNRGVLAGRRRYGAAAVAITAENGIRAVAAIALAAVGAGPDAFGVALIGGFGVAVAFPSSFRLRGPAVDRGADSPLAFLGGIAGGSVIGQVVLTGGPVALALRGGSQEEVTALFAALAVLRAPYLVATGVATRATGWLTEAVVAGDEGRLAMVWRWCVVGGSVAAGAAAGLGAVSGPLLELVFGSGVALPPSALAAAAAGSVLAVSSLVLTLVLVARNRPRSVVHAWGLGLLVASVVLLLPVDPLAGTVGAFASAELVAAALLARAAHHARSAGDGRSAWPAAGSPSAATRVG